MNVKKAYNIWAEQYDTNKNKTRDLEGHAFQEVLSNIPFQNCLEIGCGTGKNTKWLTTRCDEILAIDFSDEMLLKAKKKIKDNSVTFIKADIEQDWTFSTKQFELIACSLVLEHIEDLDKIFKKISQTISKNGYCYIGELHPFKQYAGSKAQFETAEGIQDLTCFNHHISEFLNLGKKYGFELVNLQEHFDDDDQANLPRILTILFKAV